MQNMWMKRGNLGTHKGRVHDKNGVNGGRYYEGREEWIRWMMDIKEKVEKSQDRLTEKEKGIQRLE